MVEFEKILKKFTDWKKYTCKTKKLLAEMANKLDTINIKTMKTRVFGQSIGILGSSTCLIGILLAPHTFGLSVGFTISGIAIGTLGSIISIYGSIKGDLVTHKICQEAEKLINLEHKKTDELIQIMSRDHFRRCLARNVGGLINKSASEGLNIANIVTSTIARQNLGDISNASKILLNPSRLLTCFSVGISAISLTFEIVNLVETSIELQGTDGSMFGNEIRNIAGDFDYNLNEMEVMFDLLKLKNIDILLFNDNINNKNYIETNSSYSRRQD